MAVDLKKISRLSVAAGIVIVLDQITKIMILTFLPLYDSIAIIPGFFSLTHIQNPGGAFGFMARQSSNFQHVTFIAISLLALCLVLYFYMTTPTGYPWLSAGFAMIFGGAVGNLIDRVRLGKVVDFLDVYMGQMHWPAFNVADSAISIGIAVFLFHLVFQKMPG